MNTPKSTSDKARPHPESIQHRVMKSVSEYNRQLNQERKEDRRVCMDLQTYTIQYPVGLGRDNKSLRRWIKRRRHISTLWRGGRRYPVALLPSQYQDWFLRYTAQELKYFPLNTVMYGPTINDVDKLPPLLQVGNGNNSDSDIDGSDVLSDLDDDSTCSCGEEHCSPVVKNTNENFDANEMENSTAALQDILENSCPTNIYPTEFSSSLLNNTPQADIVPEITPKNGDAKQVNQCRVCHRETILEESLQCADCGVTSHPACLDFGGDLLEAIRLYRWQCMDCKSCNQCGHPHDEEKMMFCDKCDRGYHTYCVGLTMIPDGHWVCTLCGFCANCGTKKSSDNPNIQWQHERITIHNPDGKTFTRHQVFCETCYQLRKI